MIKKLVITTLTIAALAGCATVTPEPTDTAAPPIAPAMSCDDAQSLVSDAISVDPSTLSGPEVRRRVLGADSVILANSNCFAQQMVANALDAFQHDGLDPQAYGYSTE
jgi:hypothetical protein